MGRSRYGTGHVYEKHGAWYGRWRERNGANRNKRLGPKRTEGSRDGLTKAQAERELRRVMDAPSPAERGVTVAELGRQLLSRLEARATSAPRSRPSTATCASTSSRISSRRRSTPSGRRS